MQINMDNFQFKVVEILHSEFPVICNFCLNNNKDLHYIYSTPENLDVNISFQLSETFGYQFSEDQLSNYICMDCKHIVNEAYNFTKRVKNTRNILTSCLISLGNKINIFRSTMNNENQSFSNVIIHLDDGVSEKCNMYLLKEEKSNFYVNTCSTDSDNDKNTDLQFKKEKSVLKAVCKYCYKVVGKHCLQNHLKKDHFNILLNIKCNECKDTPCLHKKYFEHIKKLRKSGDFKLICFECEKIFKHKHQFISHINSVHIKSSFPCELCAKKFTSIENRQFHMHLYHSVKQECKFCDNKFNSKEDLENHYLSCLKKKRLYSCDICLLSFDYIETLVMHKNNDHSIDKCKQCSKQSCTIHRDIKQESIKKESNQIIQNKKDQQIKKISARKRKDTLKLRICYLCTDQFKTLKELVYHLQAKHKPDEVYKCHLCHKVYSARNNYLCHIKSSTHLRKADPNFKPSFKCGDCEISYSSMLLLERHRNARHLKILPFTCEKCGKAFAAKGNLKLHLTRHSKQRNFQCNFCSALFTEPTGLKSHILRHHAPEKKKCACETCGKTFISKSECKMHQLRQHSERNFDCPLCDGKYHTNQNLRGHIKKVHLKNLSLTEFMEVNGFSKELQEVFRDRRAPCVCR